MRSALLSILRCPFCGGGLSVGPGTEAAPVGNELEYAVLRCQCSRFPVVAGIPIFKQGVIGNGGQGITRIIRFIEEGRHREALLAMILPPTPASPGLAPSWLRRMPAVKGVWRLQRWGHERAIRQLEHDAAPFLGKNGTQATAAGLSEFYFGRMDHPTAPDVRDYFGFRFGQPRHLVALSLMGIVDSPARPVLDLACGFGHVTRGLVRRAGSQPAVGLDTNFIGLYSAKRWIAPEGEYVCAEADTALPFADGAFEAAICSDAFHYFVHKAATVRELERLTGDDGFIMLIIVRNADVQYAHAGLPLTPEGYRGLFGSMPNAAVPDSAVLERYVRKLGPPLGTRFDPDAFRDESSLSVVASRRPGVLRDYAAFETWPHADGRLEFNPLYERIPEGEGFRLRRRFPSAWFEEDNAACKRYLPEEVSINAGQARSVERQTPTSDLEPLIAQCVVLDIPERYLEPPRESD